MTTLGYPYPFLSLKTGRRMLNQNLLYIIILYIIKFLISLFILVFWGVKVPPNVVSLSPMSPSLSFYQLKSDFEKTAKAVKRTKIDKNCKSTISNLLSPVLRF